MENTNFETKLFTSIGEFISPLSYEDTLKKIKDGDGVISLTRHAIGDRIIQDDKGERTSVAMNMEITAILDTNACPILCYEETKMKDIIKN